MRAAQFVTEGATPILYHYTSTYNADLILRDGEFKLSSVSGTDAERSYAPPGYPYFFSTTRSKVGDYHRYVGSGGAMWVLDGRWLSSRYPVKPIDYWERIWQHSPGRTSESEDRVFSKKNTISLDSVLALHVLLTEQDDRRSARTRRLLIAAKVRDIPTYFYTDVDAWRLQNKRKSVRPSDASDILSGREPESYPQRPVRGFPSGYGRSSLLDWLELIVKDPVRDGKKHLSKSADKLRYNITYYSDMHNSLSADLHNARKPDSNEYPLAIKLTNYMNKHQLDLKKLQQTLKQKWGTKS